MTDETKLKSPEKLEPNSTTNNQPQTTTHSSKRTKRQPGLETDPVSEKPESKSLTGPEPKRELEPDQLADSQEAVFIEKVDQELLPELALPTETRLESPEKLEPTVLNNPDRADTLLSDQPSEHPEETSPEELEPTAHNNPDRADTSLSEQLSEHHEETSGEKHGQNSSAEMTLTEEVNQKTICRADIDK